MFFKSSLDMRKRTDSPGKNRKGTITITNIHLSFSTKFNIQENISKLIQSIDIESFDV